MVRYGIPFDVAFSLQWEELVGWLVILGKIETGKDFNWQTMSWPEE